ncbi:MAG: hypothetical protein QN120_05080 [Armatimonadota bacterium]|nr:hypothetical protein [Armatimonadota bacterium]
MKGQHLDVYIVSDVGWWRLWLHRNGRVEPSQWAPPPPGILDHAEITLTLEDGCTL